MAVFKFLFVLALAVPLAVFMWNYINKLSDEFQESVAKGKGSCAAQKTSGSVPQKKEKSKKPAKKSGLRRKKRSSRTGEKTGGGSTAPAKAPAREQRQSYGSSGIGQRQVPEDYRNYRSNFEHSKMKQRYEESLRESDGVQKTQEKAVKTVKTGSRDTAARKSARPESKRARRKARKKEREHRNRETRR